jgi:hypothetical protein
MLVFPHPARPSAKTPVYGIIKPLMVLLSKTLFEVA